MSHGTSVDLNLVRQLHPLRHRRRNPMASPAWVPKEDRVLRLELTLLLRVCTQSRSSPTDTDSLDRPFLRVDAPQAGRSPSPISHFQPIQRSHTTPLPDPPSDLTNFDCAFPPFPLPRTKSLPRTGAAPKPASSAPPLPSQGHPDIPIVKTTLPLSPAAPVPPPKSDDEPYTVPDKRHQREFSVDSKSSYRTSFASTRYGDSRRSTATSSLHPSMAGAGSGNPFMDDVPPLPTAPAATFAHARQASSMSQHSPAPPDAGESYNGFHFGVPNERNSYRDEIENSGYSPFRDSTQPPSSRGSADLFLRMPSHPPIHGHTDLPDLPEERSPSPRSSSVQYQAFRVSNHLHPPGQDGEAYDHSDRARKNSDANSDSSLSVSNFARALGLDTAESTAESSIASSDISPSDTRSGTSMSSLPSETSLSRRKPSDMSRLGPVVEEQPNQAPLLDDRVQTESPTPLEPPRAPGPLFSPDSPTDPAIFHGSLSLVPDAGSNLAPDTAAHLPESPAEPAPVPRSATTPRPKPVPRPKGRCRGCGEMIMGKSVSSADGRLTGRYHRSCFVCCYCRVPFQTADFYVLQDRPYCAPHYHELNGSLCSTCNTGIEGQYLETLERRGRGITDRQKFHPECLRCRACRVVLKGDYFEWNGQVFCERDAMRAASAPLSPNRPRRPTLPSPLSQAHHYPPRSPEYGPGPGFRPGPRPLAPPGPYGYGPYGPPPPGPRRFPERRTTRLMMT